MNNRSSLISFSMVCQIKLTTFLLTPIYSDLLLVCKNKGMGKYQLKNSYHFSKVLVRPCSHRDFPYPIVEGKGVRERNGTES